MMNVTYIISQIFIVFMFICLGRSYYYQTRKRILIANIHAQLFQSVSLFLLDGFTGVAMSYVMLINDIILYIEYEKRRKKKDIRKRNILVLVFLFILIIYGTIISFNGFRSLLSVLATIILLLGIWQGNVRRYRIYGLIGSFFWLLYYIYLKAGFSIFLEVILIISMIISFKKKKVE